jgi:predicted ester cyclase
VVTAFHRRLWGEGDIAVIDELVDPNAVTVMTGFEGSTVDVLREDVDRYVAAFNDVRTEVVDLIASGDRVALWWRTTGTHVGPYGDIAPEPTGRPITMEGVDFYRVAAGRIVEVRSSWDAAAVYRQFDLLADGL